MQTDRSILEDPTKLRYWYEQQGLTMREIGRMCGVLAGSVLYSLRFHGIDTRQKKSHKKVSEITEVQVVELKRDLPHERFTRESHKKKVQPPRLLSRKSVYDQAPIKEFIEERPAPKLIPVILAPPSQDRCCEKACPFPAAVGAHCRKHYQDSLTSVSMMGSSAAAIAEVAVGFD